MDNSSIKTYSVTTSSVNGEDPENSDEEEPLDNLMDDPTNSHADFGLDAFYFTDNHDHCSFQRPLSMSVI